MKDNHRLVPDCEKFRGCREGEWSIRNVIYRDGTVAREKLFVPDWRGGPRAERTLQTWTNEAEYREAVALEQAPKPPEPAPVPRTTDVARLLKVPPMERNAAENELIRVAIREAALKWDRESRR